MAEFDYSTPNSKGPKVVLVVRENNRYGDATEGDLVTIDERDSKSRTVMSTLMSPEEANKLLHERRAKREAEEAEKRRPPKTVAMVETALAAAVARAREKALEARG